VLKYNAKDASGNDADEIYFTLILDDKTPPVLSTPSSQFVESCWSGRSMRQSWNVPAYSAMDNIDGAVPVIATVTNPQNKALKGTTIDTKFLGKYTVQFESSDNAGVFGLNAENNVASKSIVVTVRDTIKPWVTVSGSAVMTTECSETEKYVDAGADCFDHRDSLLDGKLDANVLKKNVVPDLSAVDVTKLNTFKVTYSCSDFAGNEAKNVVSREVAVVDTNKPTLVITHVNAAHNTRGTYTDDIDFDAQNIFKHINDDVVIYHSTGYEKDTQYLAKLATDGYGYSCTDTCAGKPTVTTTWYKQEGNDKTWAAHAYDNTEEGTYKLKYTCTDASGNSVSKSRTVVNEDKSSLMYITQSFACTGTNEEFVDALVKFFHSQGATFFTKDYIEVVDSRRLVEAASRMISLRFIVPLSMMPKGFAGKLLKVMRSPDFASKLNELCPVCAVKPEPPSAETSSNYLPVIYITGGDVTYVEANTVGTKYADAGATCSDEQDGLIYENKAAVATDPSNPTVDESKLGSTNLVYKCGDADLNEAIEAQRFVTVRDTTPPVCKLVGSAKVTHEAGFAYADHGCECQDSYQGKLTPVITNNVDTELVGTYASHCNAEDASGNKAATVSRTIVVADTLKPVIALRYGSEYLSKSDGSDTSTLADDSVVKNPAGDWFK